jgi:hypothetical protein
VKSSYVLRGPLIEKTADNHAAPACRIVSAQPDHPARSEPSILSAKALCGKKPGRSIAAVGLNFHFWRIRDREAAMAQRTTRRKT